MTERKMKRVSDSKYPRDVDWDQVKKLEGIIENKRIVRIGDQDRGCLTLKSEDGEWNIWQSFGLKSLFELNEGTFVQIKCFGMKKTKSGQVRIFDIFADEGQLEIPF